MSKLFPFLQKSINAERKWNHCTHSEVDWSLYECICCKCGLSRFEPDIPEDEWRYAFSLKGLPFDEDVGFVCKQCAIPFHKYKEPFRDLAALKTCVNYLERAIVCHKHFQKTAEKSKLQDSLDKCLSMRQKECLTGTWT